MNTDKKLYHQNYNKQYYLKKKFGKETNLKTFFKKEEKPKFIIKIEETVNDKKPYIIF
jgi:hypothetical protein|tara:strand:+ start:1442 stop:1615 length:174 start_codon:yes stop_codon:yes gene_type:complete